MKIDLQCGPVSLQVGANNQAAGGRRSELLVSELQGRYTAAAQFGALFHAIGIATTAAAGTSSPLAASATPILALYNPIGSGKNLAVLKHHIATVSGTPGGPLLWNFNPGPNLITASPNVSTVPGLLSAAQLSAGRVFSNTAMTGSLAMAALKIAQAIPAVAAAYAPAPFEEEAGGIMIPPGGVLALASYAAGTSHVVLASIAWEELPNP